MSCMQKRFTEYRDRREWDLSGFTLVRLSFDYRTTLLMYQSTPKSSLVSALEGPQNSLTVDIESPCLLRTGSQIQPMDPERSDSMAPLLPLLRHCLVSLTVFRSGLLVLTFEDGTELWVPKDEQYESWQAVGNGELSDIAMLCSPHEGPPRRE